MKSFVYNTGFSWDIPTNLDVGISVAACGGGGSDGAGNSSSGGGGGYDPAPGNVAKLAFVDANNQPLANAEIKLVSAAEAKKAKS